MVASKFCRLLLHNTVHRSVDFRETSVKVPFELEEVFAWLVDAADTTQLVHPRVVLAVHLAVSVTVLRKTTNCWTTLNKHRGDFLLEWRSMTYHRCKKRWYISWNRSICTSVDYRILSLIDGSVARRNLATNGIVPNCGLLIVLCQKDWFSNLFTAVGIF